MTGNKEYHLDLNDKVRLEPGATFRCHGERGKIYRFLYVFIPDDGDPWVECFGGAASKPKARSFYLDRINPDSVKRPRRKAE